MRSLEPADERRAFPPTRGARGLETVADRREVPRGFPSGMSRLRLKPAAASNGNSVIASTGAAKLFSIINLENKIAHGCPTRTHDRQVAGGQHGGKGCARYSLGRRRVFLGNSRKVYLGAAGLWTILRSNYEYVCRASHWFIKSPTSH